MVRNQSARISALYSQTGDTNAGRNKDFLLQLRDQVTFGKVSTARSLTQETSLSRTN